MDERRLASFNAWEGSVDFKLLFQAGFKYTGVRDETKCVVCNLVLENWDSMDIPLQRHQEHSPGCSIVKHLKRNQKFCYSTNNSFKCDRPVKSSRISSTPLLVQVRQSGNDLDIVENFMKSEIAQCAFDMGYSGTTVRNLAERKIKETNQVYDKAEHLISELMKEENENCDKDESCLPCVIESLDNTFQTASPYIGDDQSPQTECPPNSSAIVSPTEHATGSNVNNVCTIGNQYQHCIKSSLKITGVANVDLTLSHRRNNRLGILQKYVAKMFRRKSKK